MKLFSLALMLIAPAAMACPHSQQQFLCPGDQVYDSDAAGGTVVSVNPFHHTATYYIPGSGNYTAQVETLALGVGCLEAFCVGDQVYDSDNAGGKVVGVNPNNRTVTYYIAGSGNYIAQVDTLSVAYGCALGYCVDDAINDSDGANGRIVGISPYTDTAVYYIPGSGNYSSRIEDLSSTQYCTEYNADHPARLAQHYPALPSARYAAPNFRYYSSRR